MKPEIKERIKTLVQSLSPSLVPSGLAITVIEDNTPIQVLVSTNRHMKDLGKGYIANLYLQQYGQAMPYTTCAELLKEEIQRLQSAPAPAQTPSPAPATTAPAIQSSSSDDMPNGAIATTVKGMMYLPSEDAYYQKDKVTGYWLVVPEWKRPLVHNRYLITDPLGNSKTELDLTINGHRQTIDRGELNNGSYIKRFPSLSNVETPYLKSAFATLISSEARKAPLTMKVRTTGFYAYTDESNQQRLGYMYPTGNFLQSDGTFYPHTSLIRKMSTEDIARWSRFEDKVAVTDNQIAEAYTFVKNVTTNGLGLILLANDAMAFAHFLYSDTFKCGHVLYPYGEQGSGKTELSALCRGLGQPYTFNGSLDATFRDTMASVEDKIDYYKDIPVIIDDLSKGDNDTDSAMRNKEKTLENIGRAAYDRDPVRGRMTQSMHSQTHRYVNSLPVVTGERFIHKMATSGHRRILSIEVTSTDIHRKSEDSTTAYALDKSEGHAYTLYGLGRRVILYLLRAVERDKDLFLQQLEARFRDNQKMVRDAVVSLWNDRQSIPFPHYADSLIDIVSHILIGARLIDTVSHEHTSCVQDVFMPLVTVLYKHLCKIAKVPDEKDNVSMLQQCLRDMYLGMGMNVPFRVDGESIRIYALDKAIDRDPSVNGVDSRQWNIENMSYPNSRLAMLIDTASNLVYMLDAGLQVLASLLSTTDAYSNVDHKEIRKYLIDEGISYKAGNGRNFEKQFHRHGKLVRAMLIPLDKFLSIVEIDASEDDVDDTDLDAPVSLHQYKKSDTNHTTVLDILSKHPL